MANERKRGRPMSLAAIEDELLCEIVALQVESERTVLEQRRAIKALMDYRRERGDNVVPFRARAMGGDAA